MKHEIFVKRLNSGKRCSYVYSKGDVQGLIETWLYNNCIILTWEEAERGKQYDENSYLKDEKHKFNTVEELIQFLDTNNITITDFNS